MNNNTRLRYIQYIGKYINNLLEQLSETGVLQQMTLRSKNKNLKHSLTVHVRKNN
jgi:hypothetical protein